VIDVDGYEFVNFSRRHFPKEAVLLAEEMAILTPGAKNRKVVFSTSKKEIKSILEKRKDIIIFNPFGEDGSILPFKTPEKGRITASWEADFPLGYTGRMFATEHAGFIADIYAFKILEGDFWVVL